LKELEKVKVEGEEYPVEEEDHSNLLDDISKVMNETEEEEVLDLI